MLISLVLLRQIASAPSHNQNKLKQNTQHMFPDVFLIWIDDTVLLSSELSYMPNRLQLLWPSDSAYKTYTLENKLVSTYSSNWNAWLRMLLFTCDFQLLSKRSNYSKRVFLMQNFRLTVLTSSDFYALDFLRFAWYKILSKL